MEGSLYAEQRKARTDESVVELEQEKERPIGFLDLSAELRNMVYEHLLPVDRAFVIGFNGSVRQRCPTRDDLDAVSLMRLCRTNRQLNAEITPVIYHNVAFACVDAATIKWLKDNGPRKQMLRHVSFYNGSKKYLVSFLHQLKQANSLQSFTIGFYVQIENRYDVAKLLAPFIRAHHRARPDANAISDTIRMIRAQSERWQHECLPVGRQYQDKLRARLEEILC